MTKKSKPKSSAPSAAAFGVEDFNDVLHAVPSRLSFSVSLPDTATLSLKLVSNSENQLIVRFKRPIDEQVTIEPPMCLLMPLATPTVQVMYRGDKPMMACDRKQLTVIYAYAPESCEGKTIKEAFKGLETSSIIVPLRAVIHQISVQNYISKLQEAISVVKINPTALDQSLQHVTAAVEMIPKIKAASKKPVIPKYTREYTKDELTKLLADTSIWPRIQKEKRIDPATLRNIVDPESTVKTSERTCDELDKLDRRFYWKLSFSFDSLLFINVSFLCCIH